MSVHDGMPVERIFVNDPQGHISLIGDGVGQGAFVDLGCELHWWSHTALHLDPSQAHELGLALVAWAEKKLAKPGPGA